MTIEIKVGQIWELIITKYPATIEWADGKQVLYRCGPPENYKADLLDADIFPTYFQLRPAPKNRSIAKGDIMKMLAENPVLFCQSDNNDLGWFQITAPAMWLRGNRESVSEFKFSHNPFAPNPKIIGPEIEVVE